MEELVDISQDRSPLLFCCCTVSAPLPTLTALEYYSLKPLFSLVFLFFSSLAQLPPLLSTAFVKDGPSTTPPTPLSFSHYLTRSLIMRSSVPLAEGWETSALEKKCLGNRQYTAAVFAPPPKKKTNVRSCFSFCQHTFSFPPSRSVIPCLSDDYSH